MIKVIHVLNTGSYSGAENVAITIINSLKTEVNATYVSLEGDIEEYLAEENIKYYPIKKMTVSEIRKVIQKVNPDIIHAHDFTAGIICVATGTNIPIINHIHNNSPWIRHYNLKSFVYAWSCIKYKKIITVSSSVMDEYVFGGLFKEKAQIVGNPIDINKIRMLAGVCDDKKYDIAFLGRFTPQKNPNLFFDIVKQLKKKVGNISVIMIGDGEMKTEIKQRIQDEEMCECFTLVGFQKNPYKYLKQAKILLMPSAWEGYGLAAVEALALGLPVVCSNVGGLPSLINSSCGRICEKKDDYIEAILNICFKDDYKKYSSQAIKHADEIADLKTYTNVIMKIYSDELL